jgi:murein DD-endopeptidase MepM/ murein hydrolase activator NlpD
MQRSLADTFPRPRRASRAARVIGTIFLVIVTIAIIPDYPVIPVEGATPSDWNPASFWHYPWGESVVHKGIDIFAREGKPVVAAAPGIVLFSGSAGRGGNIALLLGPRWRLHYYAHLAETDVVAGEWRWRGDRIGSVGTTGNAAGKPPHLHYTVVTLLPYPWRWSDAPQGWMKMIFLNPGELLTAYP